MLFYYMINVKISVMFYILTILSSKSSILDIQHSPIQTRHISRAQQPRVGCGYCIGQQTFKHSYFSF